jgi:signal transduction histidine kinase
VALIRSNHTRWLLVPLLMLALAYLYGMQDKQSVWLGSSSPQALGGKLDLSGWSFQEQGSIKLNGEWDIYWSQLHDPESLLHAANPEPDGVFEVPGSWNRQKLQGKEPSGKGYTASAGTGYATYRLQVRLPAGTQALVLSVPPITSAYKLWVNGEQLGEAGVVGSSHASTVPNYVMNTVVIQDTPSFMEIILQVSNFHHDKGGIRKPLEIGLVEQMMDDKQLSIGFDTMLFGSLMIMGLYHLGLYAIRTKDRSTLYFGIFCVTIALRTLLIGEIVLLRVFPDFPWEWEMKLEYITIYYGLAFFVLFIGTMFPRESVRRLQHISGWICAGYTIFTLCAPVFVFTSILFTFHILLALGILFEMAVLGSAWYRRREGSTVTLVGSSIFGLSIVNDMMFSYEWITTTDRASALGLLIFIVSQSFAQSIKLSKAFSNEEAMSAALSEMNSGLNEKIKERTADIVLANDTLTLRNAELSRLEISRSHLLSNISHDLRTPLTTIQGYLEAIMDGMVDKEKNRERYIQLIHSKVLSMDILIDDLFQLSQLEARQVAFQKQLVDVDSLIRLLHYRYELDARSAGIGYELAIRGSAVETGCFSKVNVDVDRLQQVFAHLIYNAIKFTAEGGSIKVELVDDGVQEVICRIVDTGVGIRPEDLPFLFDRFYTSNKSRSSVMGGKGLGLSISKEIVESHGGRIRLEWSELGKGTAFYFTIPVHIP